MEDEGNFFFWVNVHVEGPWWTVIIGIIEKKGGKNGPNFSQEIIWDDTRLIVQVFPCRLDYLVSVKSRS